MVALVSYFRTSHPVAPWTRNKDQASDIQRDFERNLIDEYLQSFSVELLLCDLPRR
jgi:hypothetical protein